MSGLLSALPPGLGSAELVAGAVGLGILLALVGFYLTVAPHALEQRLSQYVEAYRRDAVAGARPGAPTLLTAIDRRVMRRKGAASTRLRLLRAGLQISVSEYITLRIGAGVALGVVVLLLLVGRVGGLALVLGAVAAIVGSYLPVVFVQQKAKRRMAALESQLPDALDMMAGSLQAGSGLGQAFELISREMLPPVSEEFRQVMQEVSLGLSLTEALTNLSDRVDSEDVDLVVTSINIQARIGGNLVHVLRTITNTIRERIRMRGEIRVLTSQQRISAVIIGLLPPSLAVILFLLNPNYMGHLFDPGITRIMLVMGVVMMVTGIFALRKIVDIEV